MFFPDSNEKTMPNTNVLLHVTKWGITPHFQVENKDYMDISILARFFHCFYV